MRDKLILEHVQKHGFQNLFSAMKMSMWNKLSGSEVFSIAELHAIMNWSMKSYFLTIWAIISFSEFALGS